MSLSGAIKFIVDDFGSTRCMFEIVLPTGAVQQGNTDLVGALNLLGIAFPASAPALQTFAAQQVTSTPTPSTGTNSSATNVNIGVNLGVKL